MSERKKSRVRVFANNAYAVKTVWGISKRRVIHTAVYAMAGYAEWIFMSIFFLRYVINAIEKEAAFENPKETAEHALQCAGVWDKVRSLPNGIDTVMTREFDSDGAVLSGGEQQKIVVARAFAQKASVKVFDEPSSALDPIAEYHLNHSMLSAAEHKSVVFISHRLSTTRIADRMLENGSIIEEGSHAALLEKGGKYAHMWSMQAGQYL